VKKGIKGVKQPVEEERCSSHNSRKGKRGNIAIVVKLLTE